MKYSIMSDIIESEGKKYEVYGISCGECAVRDISTDKEAVNALVRMCNRLGLDPCHLRDVAEDFVQGGLSYAQNGEKT